MFSYEYIEEAKEQYIHMGCRKATTLEDQDDIMKIEGRSFSEIFCSGVLLKINRVLFKGM